MLFLRLHFLILSYNLDTNTKLLPGHKRQAYQTYYLDKNARFNKQSYCLVKNARGCYLDKMPSYYLDKNVRLLPG